MRTWARESYGTSCGRCNERIEKGQPVFLISGEWGKPKGRCSNCAGEPTPELPTLDMPVHVEITPTRKVPKRGFGGFNMSVADFKNKQAGD